MSKSKSKQEEALQLLDDLDSFTPLPEDTAHPAASTPGAAAGAGGTNEGEAEVLAFLDEITQKSAEPTRSTASLLDRPASRSGTPTLRKSTERVRLGGGPSLLAGGSSSPKSATPPSGSADAKKAAASPDAGAAPAGGWGWGSVWNSASAAIQQAKTAVDEQVKYLPKNDQARKWGEGVLEYAKAAQLDKIGTFCFLWRESLTQVRLCDIGQDFKRVGLSTLTDLLNVVAPPISEHEVIQVWLSHDMRGYDGIEALVYRALARVRLASSLWSRSRLNLSRPIDLRASGGW